MSVMVVPSAGRGAFANLSVMIKIGIIARNITGVASAAGQTTEGIRQSQQATAELARMSAELTSLVSAFRY